MFGPGESALKMTRQLMERETRTTHTVQSSVVYKHYSTSSTAISTSSKSSKSSTSMSTSSCSSQSSIHSVTSFTKSESCVREVHASARAMFPEFFAQTTLPKGLSTTESGKSLSLASVASVTSSIRSNKPQKCYRQIDDEIKSWFVREYGLDNAQISCR